MNAKWKIELEREDVEFMICSRARIVSTAERSEFFEQLGRQDLLAASEHEKEQIAAATCAVMIHVVKNQVEKQFPTANLDELFDSRPRCTPKSAMEPSLMGLIVHLLSRFLVNIRLDSHEELAKIEDLTTKAVLEILEEKKN